tara:strand:- start:698 stop:1246 length:549 start_codon:yes stop_codon:yes gene_type:complete
MDDTLIIDKIRSGDSEELSKVYEAHRQEFCLWLIKHYGSHMDNALEVYQETIIAFYENIKNGKLTDLSSSLKTYLFSIGKNKYLSLARKSGRSVSAEGYLELITDDDELEEVKVKDAQLSLVEASLKKLSDHCRQLLKLYYYDKLSMEDIMEKQDYKNANTAKNQKYKCMQQLRKLHKGDLS